MSNSLVITACLLFIFILTIVLILGFTSSSSTSDNFYSQGIITDDKDYHDLIKSGMTLKEIERILPKQKTRCAFMGMHTNVHYCDSGIVVEYVYRKNVGSEVGVSEAVGVSFLKPN